jgi:hypothetical protein
MKGDRAHFSLVELGTADRSASLPTRFREGSLGAIVIAIRCQILYCVLSGGRGCPRADSAMEKKCSTRLTCGRGGSSPFTFL